MVRTTPVVAGIDLDAVSLREADGFAVALAAAAPTAGVDPAVLFIATHRIVTRRSEVHTVLTVSGAGLAEWQLWRMCIAVARERPALACTVGRHSVGDSVALEAARSAIQERLLKIGGRCVQYPGIENLDGTMTADEIIANSAIEVVCEVGGDSLAPGAQVIATGRLRPRWEFGALTLHVHYESEGAHVPFESGSRVSA